ncbi:AbrB/MazE/SpoVT family DNA-binding domain-containing protein [Nocardia higoensis]|uniref:AbrB/MazE/SpoVT family DNA-binding domain-containing protein n=1 Tax=Nocardia higoensis TaxID=228599 RepID=UPI0012F6EAC8|nr:AbrB/MazE/SpoVT family DNA-binding domain-containing protein [Nocardia higoensis]
MPPRNSHLQHGLSTVGSGGRTVDRAVFTALDWQPGTRLAVLCLDAGILLARPVPDGGHRLRRRQLLRVPYRLRRRIGLQIGDRALLIAHRTHHELLIHSPAALDQLCAPSIATLEETHR